MSPHASKQSGGTRRRTLNIIYFVDSARTKSIAIPMSRITVLLFGTVLLVAWSLASVGIIVYLGKDRLALAERLRGSLATIFEYESRYDGVYDTAYPAGDKAAILSPAVAAVAAPQLPRATPAKSGKPVEPPAGSDFAAADEEGSGDAPFVGPPAQANPGGLSAKAPLAAGTAAAVAAAPKTASVAGEATATASGPSPVTVSHPVLEAKHEALELRFDLANKHGDKAEGYLWAVAEFHAESGGVTYVAAPSGFELSPAGEPINPGKSAFFSIRRFKKKSFTFTMAKGQSGIVTNVRIGVTDRSGLKRTTYNVPVEIKIGTPKAG